MFQCKCLCLCLCLPAQRYRKRRTLIDPCPTHVAVFMLAFASPMTVMLCKKARVECKQRISNGKRFCCPDITTKQRQIQHIFQGKLIRLTLLKYTNMYVLNQKHAKMEKAWYLLESSVRDSRTKCIVVGPLLLLITLNTHVLVCKHLTAPVTYLYTYTLNRCRIVRVVRDTDKHTEQPACVCDTWNCELNLI